MARNYSNIALDTTLVAGIGAGDPTCTVVIAAGYPAAPFAVVIDPGLITEEVCQVTIKAGTLFTITRGFDGTTAFAHALGATVRHSAIAGDFTDLQTALLNVAYTNVANTFTLGNTFQAHAAIGANAAIDSVLPYVSGSTFSMMLAAGETFTMAGAVNKIGIGSFLKLNPSAASSGTTIGLYQLAETTAGNVQTHGTFIIGVYGSSTHKNAMPIANIQGLFYYAGNTAGATVTNIQGAAILIENIGIGSTVTKLAGLEINRTTNINAVTTNVYGVLIPAVVGSAPPTNNYGISIGNITGGVTLNYAIHTAGGEVRHLTGAAAVIGMIVQGFAAQSANLQEWQSSASAIYGTISENGYFTTRKVAVPADAELVASELAFWFDDTNGAGKLMIKAKTADGTVVTGNVALV